MRSAPLIAAGASAVDRCAATNGSRCASTLVAYSCNGQGPITSVPADSTCQPASVPPVQANLPFASCASSCSAIGDRQWLAVHTISTRNDVTVAPPILLPDD